MTGPRSNLAALLDRLGEREMPQSADERPSGQVRQWQQEAAQLRREELELLARDARLLPRNAAIQYRYGLSLYLNGEQQAAEQALQAAASWNRITTSSCMHSCCSSTSTSATRRPGRPLKSSSGLRRTSRSTYRCGT